MTHYPAMRTPAALFKRLGYETALVFMTFLIVWVMIVMTEWDTSLSHQLSMGVGFLVWRYMNVIIEYGRQKAIPVLIV